MTVCDCVHDSAVCADHDRLKADNARLRALVKAAEWDIEGECPWCREDCTDGHKPDCPAFIPGPKTGNRRPGEVR